jgi:hypothetical protein
MPTDPLRAHLLTRSAYYRGTLRTSDMPAVASPRLLDYLNTKARGRGSAAQQAAFLRLDTAEVTVYQGSSKNVVQASSVAIHAGSVVVAFDESRPRLSTMPPATGVSYEQRMAQERAPVIVVTRTRHRIAGIVRGGLKRLSIRTADEPYIALTEVTIEDLSAEGRAPAVLPFVALNMDFVEAFWSP